MKTIYLDNNATTRVADEVLEEMIPFFCERYGNPSSMHSFGGDITPHIDKAREQCAKLIGAKRASDIIFTSGGTESDNTAILGVLHANPSKKHIITSAVEHPAVRGLCKELLKLGYDVTEIGVSENGLLDMEGLKKSFRPDTAIVSIMWANNETGVLFPVEEIAKLCSEKEVPFHTDAVQAVGKVSINVEKTPIDLLSTSGHKFHGPKGVGFLYVRRGLKLQPFMIGGHQERGKRGGTENVPSIIGMGRAAELSMKYMDEENTKVRKLRDRLENGILKSVQKTTVHGDRVSRLPNTSNIGFENIEGESILLMLNEYGVCASSGSACTSGSLEPSHVLRAMKVPFTRAHGSIRFSLSRYNTEKEIDATLEYLPEIIEKLRAISPFK